MKTIVVSGLKGGISKSITSHCVGVALARTYPVDRKEDTLNKTPTLSRTLFVDMDNQCDLSVDLGMTVKECKNHKGILDIFRDGVPAKEIIQEVKPKFKNECKYNYGVITGFPDLSDNVKSADIPKFVYKLKKSLKSVENDYDYVVIDTHPIWNDLLAAAYTASDFVLIPTECDPRSIQGLNNTIKKVKVIQDTTNKNLKVLGVLIANLDSRANVYKQLASLIETSVKARVFKTKIRHCSAVEEARANQKSVIEYKYKATASYDYISLATEIHKILKGDIENG